MKYKKVFVLAVVAVLSFVLVGCSSMISTDTDSNLDSDGTGKLAVYLSDAPVNNIKHVYVTFDRVEIKKEGGSWEVLRDFDISNGKGKFDLLQLRFKKSVLGDKKLEAGNYTGVRFIVAADSQGSKGSNKRTESGRSYIVFDDNNNTEKEIFIPSGMQTGIKMNKPFQVKKDVVTELTLDINVKEVLHSAGKSGKIIMQPTKAFELFAEHKTGSIKGRVVNSKGNAIDITGYDVIVDIIDADGNVVKSTVASTKLDTSTDPNTPAGSFLVRGLSEGTYTVKSYVADDNGDKHSSFTIDKEKGIEVNVGEVTNLSERLELTQTGSVHTLNIFAFNDQGTKDSTYQEKNMTVDVSANKTNILQEIILKRNDTSS